MRAPGGLVYRVAEDVWEGSFAGAQIRVTGSDFAAHLDRLARRQFGLSWDELGEEEYIGVLAEARLDVAFWSAAPPRVSNPLNAVP
jgi:hypothetical protein